MLGHTNVLNRKLEEVYGVGKEFSTVASLWGKFNELIRHQQVCSRPLSLGRDGPLDSAPLLRRVWADYQTEIATSADVGVPGTGGANFGASVNQR